MLFYDEGFRVRGVRILAETLDGQGKGFFKLGSGGEGEHDRQAGAGFLRDHGAGRVAGGASERAFPVCEQGHVFERDVVLADARIHLPGLAQTENDVRTDAGRIVRAEGETRFERDKVVGVHDAVDLVKGLALAHPAVQRFGRNAEASGVLAEGLVRLPGFVEVGDLGQRRGLQHGFEVRGNLVFEAGPERVFAGAYVRRVDEAAQTRFGPRALDGWIDGDVEGRHVRSLCNGDCRGRNGRLVLMPERTISRAGPGVLFRTPVFLFQSRLPPVGGGRQAGQALHGAGERALIGVPGPQRQIRNRQIRFRQPFPHMPDTAFRQPCLRAEAPFGAGQCVQPAWADADAPGHFAHSPRRAGVGIDQPFQYGEPGRAAYRALKEGIEEQGHPALRGARL